MGGLRSSAQMISYELPMSLAIAAPLLSAGSLSLRAIVNAQHGSWHLIPRWAIFAYPFPQIFSFIIFMIAAFAETNRIPFDLPEAENELVAGFHVEYSSMSFAGFFMAEYSNMVTVCCVATHPVSGWLASALAGENGLRFRGAADLRPRRPDLHLSRHQLRAPVRSHYSAGLRRHFPRSARACSCVPVLVPILMPIFWFLAKVSFLLFVFIWIRATLPRFRYDQLMAFAWKFLFPVALVNLLLTGFLVALVS